MLQNTFPGSVPGADFKVLSRDELPRTPGGSTGDYPDMDKCNKEFMFNARGRALVFAIMMERTPLNRRPLYKPNVSSNYPINEEPKIVSKPSLQVTRVRSLNISSLSTIKARLNRATEENRPSTRTINRIGRSSSQFLSHCMLLVQNSV